jgi:hypothetical protein
MSEKPIIKFDAEGEQKSRVGKANVSVTVTKNNEYASLSVRVDVKADTYSQMENRRVKTGKHSRRTVQREILYNVEDDVTLVIGNDGTAYSKHGDQSAYELTANDFAAAGINVKEVQRLGTKLGADTLEPAEMHALGSMATRALRYAAREARENRER